MQNSLTVPKKLVNFLSGEIKENDLVLVKGSRGVRTEKVIEKLSEKFEIANQN